MLNKNFGEQLFLEGQPLDARKYYISTGSLLRGWRKAPPRDNRQLNGRYADLAVVNLLPLLHRTAGEREICQRLLRHRDKRRELGP